MATAVENIDVRSYDRTVIAFSGGNLDSSSLEAITDSEELAEKLRF